ncbi:hypothetical protein E2320_007296 [Naja naja]|nr:hypothetical protein E2320_007296 [Naja naja]
MKKTSFLLAEIHDFTSEEAQQLLHNKFVVYRTPHHLVRFYFITRAYSSYMEGILNDFRVALEADLVPDVVILHSCLWDLNSSNLARQFWFDVLDLHYYFRFLQDFHSPDGIHWNFRAHRYLTKLLLTHLAEAWQLGGPGDGLHQERNPLSSAILPDPTGLERMPISSSEGPQALLGYYPCGPERGGYDWWPVGSTEQEHGLQPGPNFNSHAPHHLGHDSWPIPSLEGVQGLPHYYVGHSDDPFHAGCVVTPISGQEYHPQPNAGYSSVPDSRAPHCVEQDVQFYPDPYIPPFQDDRPTSFAHQESRFHPNSPLGFPQGVDDARRPLSTVEQEQGLQPHHYFQAAHGSDDDSSVMGLPEQAPCPPFHPRRDLPARGGPWSTGGGERDAGFPFHTEGAEMIQGHSV